MAHGPRRMFWRIYGYGLLMLFTALGVLWVATTWLETQASPLTAWRDAAHRLADTASKAGADSARLARALEQEVQAGPVVGTAFRLDGTPLASTAQPPLGALDAEELQRLRRVLIGVQRGDGRALAVPLWSGDTLAGYVLVQPAGPLPLPTRHLWWLLALVLLALAVLAIPLARALASPLERLTRAVREFGEGRLSVRSRLKGHSEVAELGQAFDEMAARLERHIRSEKELLANVSHELRTPLARLGVTLDLLEEGQPDELARRLPEFRRDVGELQQLIEGVLQMARLDLESNQAGQPGPRVQAAPLDAAAFLQDAATRFQQAHPERQLVVALEAPLPGLDADAALLRRAVLNLLDNARKYSEGDRPITLRASATPGALRVEVEDRGIGIEAADLPSLTRPFFRTDRSRARGTGGVGLGLTLTRRIVEAHGGALRVESEPGVGTRVTLVLPPRA